MYISRKRNQKFYIDLLSLLVYNRGQDTNNHKQIPKIEWDLFIDRKKKLLNYFTFISQAKCDKNLGINFSIFLGYLIFFFGWLV